MSKTLIEQLEELPRWTPRYDGDMASSKNAEWLHIDDIRSIVKHYSEDTSLESHNRELLAMNQVLREALIEVRDNVYNADRAEIVATKTLAIKPGDIALIEVAAVDAMETGVEWNPLTLDDVKAGAKLYTIQTKSNTEWRMI